MSLSQIEMLRRRYDTAIREHAKAVKTGVNIEGTLVSAKAAGSQYMVAMTAHRIDDAVAPEDDFFSDPLKITQALRDMVRSYLVDLGSEDTSPPSVGGCPSPSPDVWFGGEGGKGYIDQFYAIGTWWGGIELDSEVEPFINGSVRFGLSEYGDNDVPVSLSYTEDFTPDRVVVIFKPVTDSGDWGIWGEYDGISVSATSREQTWESQAGYESATLSDLLAQTDGEFVEDACYRIELNNLTYAEDGHLLRLDINATYGYIRLRDVEFYQGEVRVYPAYERLE